MNFSIHQSAPIAGPGSATSAAVSFALDFVRVAFSTVLVAMAIVFHPLWVARIMPAALMDLRCEVITRSTT